MAAMEDRARLEQLSREREESRLESERRRQQEETQAQQAQESEERLDASKTEELFEYCKREYEGFKLIPTGHPVEIDKAPSCHGLTSRADGVYFVAICISHYGEETGNFQGKIPLVATRFRHGRYELHADERTTYFDNLDDLRESLIKVLAGMDSKYLTHIFRRIATDRS